MPFVRISQVPLPPGSPRALRAAALRARVADALGPALAPHLVDAHPEGDGGPQALLVVVLAGDRWDAARPEVERALTARLGRPVEVRSGPAARDVVPARGGSVQRDGRGPAERLREIAERLSRAGSGGGAGTIGGADANPVANPIPSPNGTPIRHREREAGPKPGPVPHPEAGPRTRPGTPTEH